VEKFDNGVKFLESLGFNNVGHSRRTFFDHLVSTGSLLREWGCPELVYLAGLFHAIYETESFRYENARALTREAVRSVIGSDAEKIAWLYGIATGKSLWSQLTLLSALINSKSTHLLIHRVTGEDVPCERSELLVLANITLANALDQAYHLSQRYDVDKLSTFEFLLPHVPPRGVKAFKELFAYRLAFQRCKRYGS
jgi:hypothetical protein